jgi:hypothetical protein
MRIACLPLAAVIGLASGPVYAQTAATIRCDPGTPVTDPDALRVIQSCTEKAPHFTTVQATPNGRLSIIVYGLAQYRRAYAAAAKKDPQLDPAALELYVDGKRLPRLAPILPPADQSHLVYELRDVAGSTAHPDTVKAWKTLLADGIRDRRMVLSVGFPARGPLPSNVDAFEIDALPTHWLIVWIVLAAGLLGLLVWAAISSDLLRVPGLAPAPPATGGPAPRKAFSLARTQMAAWFYVVLVAYFFIYLVTGLLDTLTGTVLGLMGISAATGFAATVADIQPAAAGAQAQATRGFFTDLVSETETMTLPRLQLAVWTAVLIFIFGRAVLSTLVMPEFDATLLGLMGISGGTYVGFKLPDKKA